MAVTLTREEWLDLERDALDDLLMAGDAACCDVCDQTCKIYNRSLSSVPARVLIAIYRETEESEFVHVHRLVAETLPEVAGQGGYTTLSVHWGAYRGARHPKRRWWSSRMVESDSQG